MNATSAAMPRKTNIVGFTSLNIPIIPADSVATVPLGVTPAPPETLTLTDGEPGAADGCDGVPNVFVVSGVGFGSNTGNFVIVVGVMGRGVNVGVGASGTRGAIGVRVPVTSPGALK
jgi:hypothetical protein